jgi:hypothetical protein
MLPIDEVAEILDEITLTLVGFQRFLALINDGYIGKAKVEHCTWIDQ